MTIDLNPDLPSSYRRPGIFTSLTFTDAGAVAPGKRCLMLGYKLPAGSASLNAPILPVNLADAIDKFGAQALVVALGVDTYEHDPISEFKLTTSDYPRIGEALASLGRPTMFVMEGGYAVDDIGVNAVSVLTGFEGR